MKKLATLFFSLLLFCFTFVGAVSPANAAAAYQANFSGTSATGPRAEFGTTDQPGEFMIIGAYDDINNIDTKNRPLKIFPSPSTELLDLELINVPQVSAAPSVDDLELLLIDSKTGRMYSGKPYIGKYNDILYLGYYDPIN